MCYKLSALVILACVVGGLAGRGVPDKRQVHPVSVKEDHQPAETGFLHAPAAVNHHGGSKFFQDIYVAMEKPDELEFGHVRESPDDWEQRFEKINLGNLKRQGKVRWGDKHGGYGEHYWDYNHAGHHDGDGEESQHSEEYAAYQDESQPIPTISREKRQQVHRDVEFIDDRSRALFSENKMQKHGGNYRKEEFRGKREDSFGKNLVFDPNLQLVVDEKTGKKYQLSPFRL